MRSLSEQSLLSLPLHSMLTHVVACGLFCALFIRYRGSQALTANVSVNLVLHQMGLVQPYTLRIRSSNSVPITMTVFSNVSGAAEKIDTVTSTTIEFVITPARWRWLALDGLRVTLQTSGSGVPAQMYFGAVTGPTHIPGPDVPLDGTERTVDAPDIGHPAYFTLQNLSTTEDVSIWVKNDQYGGIVATLWDPAGALVATASSTTNYYYVLFRRVASEISGTHVLRVERTSGAQTMAGSLRVRAWSHETHPTPTLLPMNATVVTHVFSRPDDTVAYTFTTPAEGGNRPFGPSITFGTRTSSTPRLSMEIFSDIGIEDDCACLAAHNISRAHMGVGTTCGDMSFDNVAAYQYASGPSCYLSSTCPRVSQSTVIDGVFQAQACRADQTVVASYEIATNSAVRYALDYLSAGTYTVVLRAAFWCNYIYDCTSVPADTVAFTLNGFDNATTISYNEPIPSAIRHIGDERFFTFSGRQGDIVLLHVITDPASYWRWQGDVDIDVDTGDGVTLAPHLGGDADIGQHAYSGLPRTGIYTVRARQSASHPFQYIPTFTLAASLRTGFDDAAVPFGPIGSANIGAINSSGSRLLYTFNLPTDAPLGATVDIVVGRDGSNHYFDTPRVGVYVDSSAPNTSALPCRCHLPGGLPSQRHGGCHVRLSLCVRHQALVFCSRRLPREHRVCAVEPFQWAAHDRLLHSWVHHDCVHRRCLLCASARRCVIVGRCVRHGGGRAHQSTTDP
jgi:hypothetical protein